MSYSLTVLELKEWVNSIPKQLDFEQVTYLYYDKLTAPTIDIGIMFKKKLQKAA